MSKRENRLKAKAAKGTAEKAKRLLPYPPIVDVTIDVGAWSPRLVARDRYQRFGLDEKTAEDFRREISGLYTREFWADPRQPVVTFDFSKVTMICPGWANEVFASLAGFAQASGYFDRQGKRFAFTNIHDVHLSIVMTEFLSGLKEE